MAVKKSDLYSSLWASCDELRGGMDASQYKDYVLFMLFIKYVSDKYGDSDDFAPEVTIPAGASFADMIALKGKSDIGDKINTQIIQPLIDNNPRLARSDFPDFNDPNKLGEGQAMVDRLTNLVAIFEKPELDFSKNRAENDDILGDAYEYLMRHFASQSGKSKGQFYTPSEVSRIMAKVIGISPDNAVAATTAYDPTCGSGSLLLKVAAEAGVRITLEGQEKDVTTAGLARMNMILHDFSTANILAGNTLANPKFKDGASLRTYDYVVANPPFSDKTWSTGLTPSADLYQRFSWGEPPGKQGDYAYLLHIIRSLKSEGKGACILPHGVLFRGNAEAVIRRKLVDSGYLKGIIGLPANLFYGTGIPACILVLSKENATARKGIFMIDASKGFIKDGNKNRLREQDIHRIVDVFNRGDSSDPRYARMVLRSEIADPKNDYNLNLPRYIDSSDPEDLQDIDGHLLGGIPNRDIDAMDRYWEVIPEVRKQLFKRADRSGYSQLRRPIAEVNSAIFDHQQFKKFVATTTKIFSKWRKSTTPKLNAFDQNDHPKSLIADIAETLLSGFKKAALLDAYDVYQHLMDYWADIMQDDCYQIAAEGWVAQPREIWEQIKSGKKKGEMKYRGWVCDLVPKSILVARYFADEQAEIDDMESRLACIAAELVELSEEHGGEEGVLKGVSSKADVEEARVSAMIPIWSEEAKATCDQYTELVETAGAHAAKMKELADHRFLVALKTSKGKLTLKAVKTRVEKAPAADEARVLKSYLDADKSQKSDAKQAAKLLAAAEKSIMARLDEDPIPDNYDDLAVTVRYLALLDQQSELKAKMKVAVDALDATARAKYSDLSIDEIKSMVIDDKWMPTVSATVQTEVDRVSQTLTRRVRQLAERYETPLPELVDELEALSARVDAHLAKMRAAS
ncbi:type I restriction enzyme M protein [Rhodopirellula rubra]|uniref:site-specific DNA-methyltransferase (adenine-specific) n=1 Tax=Aporhodopirellula rubra TaxID=980271 RepID=A0A7W5DVY6_9BACT|nr:class I SAM-dependent DNA methyltransferase [Aporhodopirellula rubra]MBB3205516.1 type I restriction enzyme M protein [Aporhodopirellula rubra]